MKTSSHSDARTESKPVPLDGIIGMCAASVLWHFETAARDKRL